MSQSKTKKNNNELTLVQKRELLEELKNKYSYKKKETYEAMSAADFIEEDKNLLFQVKNRLLELKEKSLVQPNLFNFLSH